MRDGFLPNRSVTGLGALPYNRRGFMLQYGSTILGSDQNRKSELECKLYVL